MARTRALLAALAPLLLHGVARELDRALGLVLKAELPGTALVPELGRALVADGAAALVRVAAWVGLGLGAWVLLARKRARRDGTPLATALEREAMLFGPLLLRPSLTLLAIAAVAMRPEYPYGFTLPVALTQDWSAGQDLAALAVILALGCPSLRVPVPRGGELFLVALLGYAALAPAWAFRWEGHPGNEPKYLRQAVALALSGRFDAEGVSGAMEELPARGTAAVAREAARTLAVESRAMIAAVLRGDAGRGSIRATRITRQTVRGKDGGVFYVLAPGPSLMLAPTLRADRAVNRARGESGRVALTTLAWCALGALLVVALRGLVSDATGRPGLATALALGFGVLPPFLFFFYQYYPEMVGALVLAVAFRVLALRPGDLLRHPWRFGWLLATLPWLHQKFLPVWAVLTVTALCVLGFSRARSIGAEPPALSPAGASWRLLVPQATSLYLVALYNFAITGSVRPDALFLAWGPGGVTSARVGQGVLGLLLDARFGILPWVPLLLLALAGLASGGARRFAVVLPSAAAYYLTVASADNWSGAVCNLGRYFMPVAPLAVALTAVALARATDGAKPAPARRGAVALALVLAAWSAAFASALWRDPQAANDSALLLARSTYADGNQYLPNLFIRHWSDAAPGLWARIAAWLAAAGLLALGVRRTASPGRALAALAVATLALGFVLERWPSTRSSPVHADGLNAPASSGDTLVFFAGAVRVREDEAVLGPGDVELLVRQRLEAGAVPAARLPAVVGGAGVLRVEGLAPLALRPTGALLDLPLITYHGVSGGDGRRALFSRLSATVSGQGVVRFGDGTPRSTATPATEPAAAGGPDQGLAEPGGPGSR